jgi:secondary thiamine-phosphate synthase enzyme
MTVDTHTITISSKGDLDAHNITDQVANLIQMSALSNGTVTLFTPSSTSGITTIEFEQGCLSDLKRLFEELADPNRHYAHNERWHDGNGHAHVCAAILGPSITIPFIGKQLTLGIWQQIVFVDFDNKPRQREIIAQIIGG